MAELKHLKTFESYYTPEVLDTEKLDEGLIKDVVAKLGVKAEDFLTQWKNPETIKWAKRMAKAYLQKGTLSQEAYDKALAVDFNPSNNDSREFFLQMAKIKGALQSAPMSASTTLLGNS
jgi:hypothetical protein